MTPGARRVLQELAADDDCDLVQSGNLVYCGDRQTNFRTLKALIECMAVSVTWNETETSIYYGINETGRAILRRPELEQEIRRAVLGRGGAFTIRDDKVVPI